MFHQRFEIDAHDTEVSLLSANGSTHAWAALLTAMISEVDEGATDEQLQGFFHAVGGRIAAMRPLADLEDLDDIVGQINLFWSGMGWGSVILELDDEGIDIHHSGMPAGLDGNPRDGWAKVAPLLLEGVYESWFRSLGSGPTLTTHVQRISADRIELRHGH